MNWIKSYESYTKLNREEFKKLQDLNFKEPYFFGNPVVDREGNESLELELRPEPFEQIKWFNDMFNHIGVWMRGVPVGSEPQNKIRTLITAEIIFDLNTNLSPETEMDNISSRVRKDNNTVGDATNIFYYMFKNDIYPMALNPVHILSVKFANFDSNIETKSTGTDNWRGITFDKPFYYIKHEDTKQFMNIVLSKLNDYINHNFTENVYIRGAGTNIHFPFFLNIFKDIFKPDITVDEIYKVVYREICNRPNVNELLNSLKGTHHYDIFRKMGGEDVDNAANMHQRGFDD